MIEIEPNYQKRNEFKNDDLVCYCFKHTKRDIENDFMKNGRSLIYEKIALEKKKGACNCATENPKGRWRLADVHRVVETIKKKKAYNERVYSDAR